MLELFEMWPTVTAMAKDLGEPEHTVRAWKRRGNIPADRDVLLVKRAKEIESGLTFEKLAVMRHSQRPSQ